MSDPRWTEVDDYFGDKLLGPDPALDAAQLVLAQAFHFRLLLRVQLAAAGQLRLQGGDLVLVVGDLRGNACLQLQLELPAQ